MIKVKSQVVTDADPFHKILIISCIKALTRVMALCDEAVYFGLMLYTTFNRIARSVNRYERTLSGIDPNQPDGG